MRKPVTSTTAATVTAALATVALAACGSSGSTSAGTSASAGSSQPTATAAQPASSTAGVTLVVGDQAGTGAQTLLQASGLIKQLPFKVKWADFTSGPPMLQAMSAGHVDIGGVGDAPPVFSAAGGANLAIVGALADGTNAAAVVVPANSPIKSISQLKGKKIAVAQGSSADYHLLTVLEKAGLKPTDVTLDYLQPADGLAALQAGQVDAWDIWSPFIEDAVAKGDRILVNGKGYGAPYSYEVASKSSLQDPKKVAAIKIYLKVLDQAHLWANHHPAQWAAVWAQATGLPTPVMVKAAKDDVQKPTPVTSKIVASEQGLVNSFYSAGLIPKSYSFGPFVTSAFNSGS